MGARDLRKVLNQVTRTGSPPTLCYELVKLVFSTEEILKCCGLGIRSDLVRYVDGQPLDSGRISVIKGGARFLKVILIYILVFHFTKAAKDYVKT